MLIRAPLTTDTKELITFKTDDVKHFQHGYAITAHRSQGVTVDKALTIVDGHTMDQEKLYVAMSRGKESNMLFADKPSLGELSRSEERKLRRQSPDERAATEHEIYRGHLSRMAQASRRKDTTQDYLDQRSASAVKWDRAKSTTVAERFQHARERVAEEWQGLKERFSRISTKDHERTQEPAKDRGKDHDRGGRDR